MAATQYTVVAPKVVVLDADGRQQYLNGGALLPEYVDADAAKDLLAAGLVEKVKPARSRSTAGGSGSGESGSQPSAGGPDPAQTQPPTPESEETQQPPASEGDSGPAIGNQDSDEQKPAGTSKPATKK